MLLLPEEKIIALIGVCRHGVDGKFKKNPKN